MRSVWRCRSYVVVATGWGHCAALRRGTAAGIAACERGLLVGAVWLAAAAMIAWPVLTKAVENLPAIGSRDATISFDIPSQPLEDALYAFGAASGIEVFVDGSAVGGRRSTAVKGTLTVTQALQLLLSGTGLDAHAIGNRAITLSADRPQMSSAASFRDYSAILQKAALRQLCGMGGSRPGSFRIAMQLWLDDAGGVERVELLSSTGDPARDEQIRGLLKAISVTRPPPALPQPIVMVILPRPAAESGDCIGSATAAARRRQSPQR